MFLDRDGTINVRAPEGHYITQRDELALLPEAGAAIARLNQAGLTVVVVTNQRAVAKGMATVRAIQDVNRRLSELLFAEGARLDAIYVCPHEKNSCGCRKPAIGMAVRAAQELPGIQLERSVMIGDSASDVEFGVRAGMRAIRIGIGGAIWPECARVTSLAEAVGLLCGAAESAGSSHERPPGTPAP